VLRSGALAFETTRSPDRRGLATKVAYLLINAGTATPPGLLRALLRLWKALRADEVTAHRLIPSGIEICGGVIVHATGGKNDRVFAPPR